MKHTARHTAIGLFFALALAYAPLAFAVDASYYSSLEGKSGSSLFSAVGVVSSTGYVDTITYKGIWNAYKKIDVDASGNIIDIYSNCTFTAGSGQCGNYSKLCDCYNREHSVPQNWFGSDVGTDSKGVAGTDLFHVYPTDGKVNGTRSNYPYGETTSGTTWGTGKLGTSTFTNYESIGTVFEPADEYKGDLARSYFYMITFWGGNKNVDFTQGTYGAVHFTENYTTTGYGLTNYSIALLMKWHRQDPVSQKEIDRNNGIQSVQGNRNPFIDYPYLAEYLWGEKASETVSLTNLLGSFESDFVPGTSNGSKAATDSGDSGSGSGTDSGSDSGTDSGTDSGSNSVSTDPLLMIGTPIVVENVKKNDIVCAGTTTLQVHISNLATSVAVSSSNTGIFTVTPSTISPAAAANGVTVTLTRVATGSATLTISGGVVNQTIGVTCE